MDEHGSSDFIGNDQYLGWEMLLLRRRLEAFVEARRTGDVAAFVAASAELRQARLATRARRESSALPLGIIAREYKLSPLEEEVLLLGVASHLSAATADLILAARQGRPGLSVGFVADLLDPQPHGLTNTRWVRCTATLVAGQLIELGDAAGGTLSRVVTVPEYLAAAITGRPALDERLEEVASLCVPNVPLFDLIVPEALERELEVFRGTLAGLCDGATNFANVTTSLGIIGAHGTGKTTLALAMATATTRPLVTLHCRRLADRDHGVLRALSLAAANARFLGAGLHIEHPDRTIAQEPAFAAAVARLAGSFDGLVIIECGDSAVLRGELDANLDLRVDLGAPDRRTRNQLWESLIPRAAALDDVSALPRLANTYELSGRQIESAIAWGCRRARARGSHQLLADDLEHGARLQIRGELDTLTRASEVQLSLDDLVLPDDVMAQVEEFVGACRHHQTLMAGWGFGRRLVTGRGLVALFSGNPGTGKTLTAEIVARELGRKLRIVNLPDVVSKWIGETSKNVREIFRQARAENAVLLFDEADALFAKRIGKVERSADQYLNMEINNLLQEIERHDGIVMLTTNLETNMDEAFARRILFKVEFPEPDEEHREILWDKLVPEEAPRAEDIDSAELAAGFELTGAQIKNAVVRAAYRAATRRTVLSQSLLSDAAADEAVAGGRLTRL